MKRIHWFSNKKKFSFIHDFLNLNKLTDIISFRFSRTVQLKFFNFLLRVSET